MIHCNDWQTALVPIYLKDECVRWPEIRGIKIAHEVPDHAVLLQTEQAAVDPPPAQGHLDVADEFHLILPLVRYPLIRTWW